MERELTQGTNQQLLICPLVALCKQTVVVLILFHCMCMLNCSRESNLNELFCDAALSTLVTRFAVNACL